MADALPICIRLASNLFAVHGDTPSRTIVWLQPAWIAISRASLFIRIPTEKSGNQNGNAISLY